MDDVTSPYDGLLLVSEAARTLGLSAQRVRVLADQGVIACIRTPFGRLFDPTEVERFRATRGPFGRYRLGAPHPVGQHDEDRNGATP